MQSNLLNPESSGFVSLVYALKAMWVGTTTANAKKSGMSSPDETDRFEFCEKDCTALFKKVQQCVCEADSSSLEQMVFTDAPQFLALIIALSIAPVPSLHSQFLALETFKLAAARLNDCADSTRHLFFKTFEFHQAFSSLLLALENASNAPAAVSITESLFTAIMTNEAVASFVLFHERFPEFVATMHIDSETEDSLIEHRRTPVFLYYFVSILFKLVHVEPQKKAVRTLAESGVHYRLLYLLGPSEDDVEVHATVRGVALHVLAVMAENDFSLFQSFLDSRELVRLCCRSLASPWSEIIDGCCRLISAASQHANDSNFFSSFIFQNESHVPLLSAIGSSHVRVASSAANALRRVMQFVSPSSGVDLLIIGNPNILSVLMAVMLDALNSQSSHDMTGIRILRAEVALILGMSACRNPEARKQFSAHFGATYSSFAQQKKFIESFSETLNDIHVSVLENVELWDCYGTCLNSPFHWIGGSDIHPPAELAQDILVQQERRQTLLRESGVDAGMKEKLSEEQKWFAAYLAKDLIETAVKRAVMKRTDVIAEKEIAGSMSVLANPQPPAHRSYQTESFDKAFRLVMLLSKNHQGSHESKSRTLSPARNEATSNKKKNLWAPLERKSISTRKWSIQDIQRGDLFVFAVPAETLREDLPLITMGAKEYCVYLKNTLEVCPGARIARRCLLIDLLTNVAPKIFFYLSNILQRISSSDECLEATLLLLRERQSGFLDNGNIKDVSEALVALYQ